MHPCYFGFYGLVFFAAGLTLIIVGGLYIDDFEDDIYFENESVILMKLIISIGVFVLLLSLLGCCIAACYDENVTSCFIVWLSIMLVVNFAIGIMAFINSTKVDGYTDNALKGAIDDVFDDNNDAMDFLNSIHEKFSCCGYLGPSDFNNATDPMSTCGYNNGLPSCHRKKNCQKLLFTDGCKLKFSNSIKQRVLVAGGVAFSLFLLQLIFCFALFCSRFYFGTNEPYIVMWR
ncbi:23 kDa integral membrane protein-like [Hydra vulgaris]|uniref:Tetraspanin n=1 Tax=Hydra vulgaris TaxID=6087 RepID=A0ABM4CTR3_HYDVU